MKLQAFVTIATLLCIPGAEQVLLAQSKQPVNQQALIDSFNTALFRTYIFPDKSESIIRHLNGRLKQQAYKKVSDPSLLALSVQNDINAVHFDRHLRIYYEPSFEAELRKPRTPPVADEAGIAREKSNNFSFTDVQVLNGNIGYLAFNGFSSQLELAKPTITAAFRFLANTEALIIDLRKNGGGSPWMVKQIASYLVKDSLRLNDIYERRLNKTVQFWADPAQADSANLLMPVYILTSRQTFSAAEDFTYALQAAKRAIVVGDTTGGGAHPTGPVPLGQGFVADIPMARSVNYITGADWEGTGVLPDHPCAADKALLQAQTIILTKKMTTAGTDDEKQRAIWLLHALQVHDYDGSIDLATLKTYTGDYDRFTIFIKGDKLYIDDLNGKGRQFLLRPVTPTLYLGSDWFQVEFVARPGQTVQLKMLGKPGWVNVYEKK